MTEKEKMLAELDYLAFDPELLKEREKAKTLCHTYNHLSPAETEEKARILEQLLGQVAEAHIEPTFYCDYGYNILLGKQFYANHNLVILDVCPVHIGDNVMLGPNAHDRNSRS